MTNNQVLFMVKVVKQLKKKGWKEQQSGIDFFNGMLSVSLIKDGEVMSIQYDFYPEQWFIQDNWPGEKHKKSCPFKYVGDENGNYA